MACNPIEILFPSCDRLGPVSGIAALRAFPVFGLNDSQQITVNGDGQGSVYVWNPSSLATDNGSTVIKPDGLTLLQAGRWLLQFSGFYLSLDEFHNGRVAVEDFGVVGDGVTDDTLAMLRVAQFINSTPGGAAINIGRHKIKITGDILFQNSVGLAGQGHQTSGIVCYGNARMLMDGNRVTQPNFWIDKMSILTDGIHTSSPLKVDFSPHFDGLLTPTFTMRDSVVTGREPLSGFTNGIELVDCPWPKFYNVEIGGDFGRGGAALSKTAVKYTGEDGSASFNQLRCYYVEEAVHCEGSMEGVQFDDCEIVAVQRGVTYRATLGGAEPYVVVSRCHINAEECSVRLTGVNQFHIGNGSLFYAQPFKGLSIETHMVDIIPSETAGSANALPVSGSVSGLTLFGSSKTNCHGIHIAGTTTALEEYTISNTRIEAMGYGIWLDAPTNGVFIDSNVTYRNVNVPVTDLGGAGLNIREPRVVQGFSVGTTDSSGQITVSFGTTPTGDKFFAAPIVVAGGGDGGAETYTVVASSVTTNGCKVQVANAGVAVAAGVTRRINFIAAGN